MSSLPRSTSLVSKWLLDGLQDLEIFFEGFDEGLVVDGGGGVVLGSDFEGSAPRRLRFVQFSVRLAYRLQLK